MAESSQPGIEWVLTGERSLCQRHPCTERLCEQKDMEPWNHWGRRETCGRGGKRG